jgi:hypothetical protein
LKWKKEFSKLDPKIKVVQNLILYNIALGHNLKFQIDFELEIQSLFKSKSCFSRLFLKENFGEILNTKLSPKCLLNISKLFLYSNKHLQGITSNNITLNLLKQKIATCMFRKSVSIYYFR